ncbi:MAG: hypothetical protein ACXVRI_05620, partial [Gaiellaceae bacterium]
WEAEYRLRVVEEFDGYAKVFLFATQPAHKGRGSPGSRVLAELIKTHNPRVAVVAGERTDEMLLGKTLVVCPGRVDRGDYALIDLQAVWLRDHTEELTSNNVEKEVLGCH